MKWLVALAAFLFAFPSYAECDYLVAIRMDKSFSKKQKDAVEKAAGLWYDASMKKICFLIVEADVSKPEDYSRDDVTTIYSGHYKWQIHAAINHGCLFSLDGCLGVTTPSKTHKPRHDIFLVRHEDFRMLVAHELGHVLGLNHSKSKKDLMFEDIRSAPAKLGKGDMHMLKCLLDKKKLRSWDNNCH